METLKINAEDDTPLVHMNKENEIFEISGRSLPEDTVGFYQPLMDWLKAYATSPNERTDFIFKLDYFNTSSSKMILDIIQFLKTIKGARIIWYSREDDEEVADAGEEYAEQINIPFEFKTY